MKKITGNIISLVATIIATIIIYNRFYFKDGNTAFQSCALSICLIFINSIPLLFDIRWRKQDKTVKVLSAVTIVVFIFFFFMLLIIILKETEVLEIVSITEKYFIRFKEPGNYSILNTILQPLSIEEFCGLYCIMYIALPVVQIISKIIIENTQKRIRSELNDDHNTDYKDMHIDVKELIKK